MLLNLVDCPSEALEQSINFSDDNEQGQAKAEYIAWHGCIIPRGRVVAILVDAGLNFYE